MDFSRPHVNYPINPYWTLNRMDTSSRSIGFSPPSDYAMARQGAVSLEEIIKNKVANFRRWKQTKLSKRHPRWGFQFSVMTYNILSQTAVENHRYLYRHCSNAFLQEDYRISRILPEILNSKSDIICLQEVEQHLFDNRIKQLFDTKGFESIFKKRTFKNDGCAILWRRKKFNLLKHSEVEFKAKGNKFLNRDNIGLIAVLEPIHPNSGNTQLHVATTHLLFNPKRGEVKLCQLRLLLAELEKMALKEVTDEERLYHPTILCGDFNIEPHSPLYEFIESGSVDITNALSGDLSGQLDGTNKGRRVNGNQLSLHRLGISKSSRYEEIPDDGQKLEDFNRHSDPESNTMIADSTQCRVSLSSNPKPNDSDSIQAIDPSIIHAVGSSNDPRWLQTLMAIGQEKFASEIASRIISEQNVPNKSEENVSDINFVSAIQSLPNGDELPSDEIRFSHDFKFVPAYKFHQANRKDMPVTSMTGRDFHTVDHIFYNAAKKLPTSFSEGQLRLLGLYSLMRTDEIVDIGGLPNACLGSDHICLIAQFGLCFKR